MENNVKIELPVNAWNIVMAALGQRPFVEVSELIAEMKKQAEPQIQKIQNSQSEV